MARSGFGAVLEGEHDDVPPAPFVRNPYNYNVMAVSNETGLKCEDPSLAQQQFKEETDVNYIVDRYTRTGELPPGSQIPQFGDFTGVSDYHSALNLVRQSQEEFMSLPPAVRSRFENDPGKLLDFLTDDKNRAEAVKLGLVESEDLSTAPPAAPKQQAGGAVEKSAEKRKLFKAPSIPKGYKLVPEGDSGGLTGDDE